MSLASALIAPVLSLPQITCKFPKSSRSWKTDPTSVVLREFLVGQEMDAITAAAATNGRFEYELLERIVVEVDGKPHDQGTPFIDRCSPKIRVLLVRALNKMTMPTTEELKDFDDGLEVRVP